MVSELAQYAIDYVMRRPGERTRDEVIRNVRLHVIITTNQDPGNEESKAYVDEAFRTGMIEEREKTFTSDMTSEMRCYPKTS